MDRTAWMLADIDLVSHVVPYTWVEAGVARGPTWGGTPLGVIGEGGPSFSDPLTDGHHANCPYNHPNYPDGFLRTSVNQLSRYLRAFLGRGEFGGRRVLTAESIAQLFRDQNVGGDRTQGLTWYSDVTVDGEGSWGHGGSDSGSNTDLRLLPDHGVGAIVFANTNGVNPREISNRLLHAALEM